MSNDNRWKKIRKSYDKLRFQVDFNTDDEQEDSWANNGHSHMVKSLWIC
jgi:hypothetical protein